MGGLLEPRLDPTACTDVYNVYQLCEPGGGGTRGGIHPPLYLPRRYSELTFTALGHDARELLFSAYDEVTRDYVVVELVRAVDAVGGAWLLANFELVVLLLRTRLRHQTLLRVLDVWTPPLPQQPVRGGEAAGGAGGGAELRSFAVAYECARQQLSYYLVPYLLLKQTMPHWRLSNMLYQIVWAAHHLHASCGGVRLNNVWDVPITGFLYDDDTCAVKLNLKLLVTVARRSGGPAGSGEGGAGDDRDDGSGGEERAAVRGLGRMLVRYLAATVVGTLDVGAQSLAAPEPLLDRLLAEMRFTCADDGSGCEQLFEHWAEETRAAGLADADRQMALLKDFLAQLLLGTADDGRGRSEAEAAAAAAGTAAATFAGVLSHPYVRAWKEEGDLDYEVDADLAAALELVRSNGCGRHGSSSDCAAEGGSGRGVMAAAATASGWELPLHSLMTVENRFLMFREIKRFEHAHPHRVRSLADMCAYRLASASQRPRACWSLLPPALARRVRSVHRGLFVCGTA